MAPAESAAVHAFRSDTACYAAPSPLTQKHATTQWSFPALHSYPSPSLNLPLMGDVGNWLREVNLW
jgi:hypothetical protein